MTDTPETPDAHEDREALAGELSLRVLSPEDEARAQALAAADPDFALEVGAWDERLAGLVDGIAPVQPSAKVWPRIAQGIATPSAANDNSKLVFWRRWAVGSTALLAASLAAVAIMLGQPAPVAPVAPEPVPAGGVTRVSTVAGTEGGPPMVMLAYDSATGKLYVAPTKDMAGAGGAAVPHLWLVLPDGAGVRLIGAIDGSHAATHNLNANLGALAGQAPAVAISMEVPGHSPAIDKPDGPVVATGELQQL